MKNNYEQTFSVRTYFDILTQQSEDTKQKDLIPVAFLMCIKECQAMADTLKTQGFHAWVRIEPFHDLIKAECTVVANRIGADFYDSLDPAYDIYSDSDI